MRRVPMPYYLLIIVTFLSVSVLPSFAVAQGVAESDLTIGLTKGGPLGVGGAYRALANDYNAMLLNPAGMAQSNLMSFAGDWFTSGYLNQDVFAAGVVDGSAGQGYAYGVGYDLNRFEILGTDVDYHQVTLALAYTLLPNLHAGASAKYYHSTVEGTAVNGPDGFSADFGTLYTTKYLSAALTLQNVTEGNDNPNIPFLLSGGLAFKPDDRGALMIDFVKDFSTPNDETLNLHFGGLFSISPDVQLRSGFGWDRIRDNPFLGLGVAGVSPQAILGFTYVRHFESSDNTYAIFIELRANRSGS